MRHSEEALARKLAQSMGFFAMIKLGEIELRLFNRALNWAGLAIIFIFHICTTCAASSSPFPFGTLENLSSEFFGFFWEGKCIGWEDGVYFNAKQSDVNGIHILQRFLFIYLHSCIDVYRWHFFAFISIVCFSLYKFFDCYKGTEFSFMFYIILSLTENSVSWISFCRGLINWQN